MRCRGVGGKKVQLIALDEIVGLGDGQKIDFIKMDVEGHELSVLWGVLASLNVNSRCTQSRY